ncbi:MAG: hypothetical protein E7660_02385 [Ruminococcaceae bacterium]|nr:hypothetical protein [Oscillospiraceae bacterium]
MKSKTLVLILAAVILTSMIFTTTVFAADASPSDIMIFRVSDATVFEGAEKADFTLSIENNPGIYAIVAFIAYDDDMSLAAFDFGTVFTESEFALGNPLDDPGQRDKPASNSSVVSSAFKEWDASTKGMLATTVYAENSSTTENNTNNGIVVSFSLNTSALSEGVYDIAFYMKKSNLCNIDFEDVPFEIIQGKLTVVGCFHELEKRDLISPDCVNEGYTQYYCSVCDKTYKREIVPALGHDNEEVVTEPTCTASGFTTYTCKVCGEVSTGNKISALGHKFKTEVYKEPTCTEDGDSITKCSRCDFSRIKEDGIPAEGHELKKETVLEPTYSDNGKERTYCIKCNYEEFRDIPKLNESENGAPLSPPPVSPPPASPPPGNYGQSDSFVDIDLSYGAAPGVPTIKEESTENAVEKEELKPDKNEASYQTENKTENKNYQTGDSITLFVILLAASVLGATAIVHKRKRQIVK